MFDFLMPNKNGTFSFFTVSDVIKNKKLITVNVYLQMMFMK